MLWWLCDKVSVRGGLMWFPTSGSTQHVLYPHFINPALVWPVLITFEPPHSDLDLEGLLIII